MSCFIDGGNLHSLGKGLTNPAVDEELGLHFEEIDLTIKALICRCLSRNQVPEDDDVVLDVVRKVFTDRQIVTLDWIVSYLEIKISDKPSSLSGKRRIAKFIKRIQEIFFAKLAFIFFYSSRSLSLRSLEDFDNNVTWKDHYFGKKSKTNFLGISGWFMLNVLCLNYMTDSFHRTKAEGFTTVNLDEDNEPIGLIRNFVVTTFNLLKECAEFFEESLPEELKAVLDQGSWTTDEQNPIEGLCHEAKLLRNESLLGFKASMEKLRNFLETHDIHCLLAGFRNINKPSQFNFDILTCSVDFFRQRCNNSYMASIGKTGYLAIVQGRHITLSGNELHTQLTDKDDTVPSMKAFILYFQSDYEKARI